MTTLYASARRRTCLRSRFGKAASSAWKSAIKSAQVKLHSWRAVLCLSAHTMQGHGTCGASQTACKHATADAERSSSPDPETLSDYLGKPTQKQQMSLLQGVVSAGSAFAGGVKHSARCIDTASDRAAATTKYGVKSGAVRVKHAALVSGCWVHDRMQVRTPRAQHQTCVAPLKGQRHSVSLHQRYGPRLTLQIWLIQGLPTHEVHAWPKPHAGPAPLTDVADGV